VFKNRLPTTTLAIFGLIFQALVPFGQAIVLPGVSEPLVICTRMGLIEIDPNTGAPVKRDGGPSKSADPCLICQSLVTASLQPASHGEPAALPVPAGPSVFPQYNEIVEGIAFRLGVFARPPPAAA